MLEHWSQSDATRAREAYNDFRRNQASQDEPRAEWEARQGTPQEVGPEEWEALKRGLRGRPAGAHRSGSKPPLPHSWPLALSDDMERLAREIDAARKDLNRRNAAAWVVLIAGALCMAVGVGAVLSVGGWGPR